MTPLLPPKKDVALALLERSNVDMYLDPRAKGVIVPPQFRKEPRLILKVGLNMPVPIPDLRVDDDSMSCTLSFNRSPFFCVVPWSSLFAMVGEDGRGMVWPEDVPRELTLTVGTPAEGKPSPVGARAREPNKRGGLQVAKRERNLVALAPVPEPTSKEAEAASEKVKPAKRKKKKDAPRPRPVLVTPDFSRQRNESEENSRDESSGSELPSQDSEPLGLPFRRDGVSAIPHSSPRQPASSSKAGAPRPKRELPPYLRIVK